MQRKPKPALSPALSEQLGPSAEVIIAANEPELFSVSQRRSLGIIGHRHGNTAPLNGSIYGRIYDWWCLTNIHPFAHSATPDTFSMGNR
jgi:hypothetical protein